MVRNREPGGISLVDVISGVRMCWGWGTDGQDTGVVMGCVWDCGSNVAYRAIPELIGLSGVSNGGEEG